MARLACVILPEYPHYIIQHGNRRQDIFSVGRIMSIDRTWLAYVEMNPVKTKIVAFTTDYCCSSVHAHLTCHAPLEIITLKNDLGMI